MNAKIVAVVGTVFFLGLLLGSCGKKQSERELRSQAQLFEKEENYEEALRTYEEQLKNYPEGEFADEAVQKIAYLHYNNFNNFDKAIEFHKTLIEDYPDSKFLSQARFMIGYIYANNLHDYDSAEAAYKEFLKYHPDDELAESVNWELEHLGQDINEQLKELFSNEKSNGQAKVN